MSSRQVIRLYGHPLSGHAHRVRLFLSLLQLPHEVVEVDLLRGEHKRPEFLAMNPLGQVPVVEDGDLTLADSNAILVYLAGRYDSSGRWLPKEPEAMARVQRWLSIAAGQLFAGPGMARVEVVFKQPRDPRRFAVAKQLFTMMDAHLAAQPFLASAEPTIADLALYTYTSHAPEGGVSLEPYAHLRAWLERVEALPGFVGMLRNPPAEPLAA